MRTSAHIEIEGLRELQQAIKRAQGRLPESIGQANRRVGNFIIQGLPPGDPHAVGARRGSQVRASATKREVLLRVGHGGRESARNQWGVQPVQPFRSGRPYIVGFIEAKQREIEDVFMAETMAALSPAFYDARIS